MDRLPTDEPTLELSADELLLEHGIRLQPDPKKGEVLIDDEAWLAGFHAFERGEECPFGDVSAREGWIAATRAAR